MSGLASGFDWQSVVTQLITAERTPEKALRTEQSTDNQKSAAYTDIGTRLGSVLTAVDALKDPTLYQGRAAQVGNSSAASATAGTGAALGTYTLNFDQLATAAVRQGTSAIASPLNASDDVSSLTIASAGVAVPITAGVFTVNGQQVTVATTDTLKSVFDKIKAATTNAVTASYNHTTDKISLQSSSEIVLGSATDTSNFLAVMKLSNNGTSQISSAATLGRIQTTATLAKAGFASGVTGTGQFAINGVSISYDSATDTVQGLIDRINGSGAGVVASYDPMKDRFLLTNSSTGDIGIGLSQTSGTFLTASGLLGGSLQHGKNLIYRVNGGDPLVSNSNTITDASSGITGVSVTALTEGSSTSLVVTSDTSKVTTAVNNFVNAYNQAQGAITSYTASSTDSQGNVTPGILSSDSEANEIARKLRSLVTNVISGNPSGFKSLDDLGIVSNGQDDTLSVGDATKLATALANNPGAVQSLFTDSTNGLAVNLDAYITQTTGDSGTISVSQNSLTTQSKAIDDQIAAMERTILADQQRLTQSFVAMESAQASINSQLSFLTNNKFGGS